MHDRDGGRVTGLSLLVAEGREGGQCGQEVLMWRMSGRVFEDCKLILFLGAVCAGLNDGWRGGGCGGS